MQASPPEAPASVALADEAATARLAEDIAAVLQPGDLVALSGGLGAGKTTFSRALVRALADDPALAVQSPTFPLRIDYALARMKVAHVDLYRLGSARELDEIGLEEALEEGALLVEWPELLPAGLSRQRLGIAFSIDGEGRRAEIVTGGSWPSRLARSGVMRRFLDAAGWRNASRVPIAGDASYRAYERVRPRVAPSPSLRTGDGKAEGAALPASPRRESAILMNAPARSEGPKIYNGRSYDDVAHRAMDVRAFVAIGNTLRGAGIRAPEILAAELDDGLLLTEDLGGEVIVDAAGAPILARYEAAVDLLVFMHARAWPPSAPLPDGTLYRIPPYDRAALLVEISLFPDWFGGQGGEPAFPSEGRERFLTAWSDLLDTIAEPNSTWTLRDFHSPNILWQGEAAGIARVGIIDFQDALMGHPAYDVASLAQDARVTLSADEEARLKARYIAGRRHSDPAFDVAGFERAYAIFALQRATKVLGIFTRLALAEGKPGYSRHRARLKALIRRTLADPVLSALRLWYEPYV